jgi:uncharacterized membrane protein
MKEMRDITPRAETLSLYSEESRRLLSLRRSMEATRNLSVFIIAGMAYFAFGLAETSSHLILILGSLTVFALHVFEARAYQFADVSHLRVREIEKNLLAPSLDPSASPESGWEQRLASSLVSPRPVGYIYAFAARAWKNYILIFITLDVCWFSKLYLYPHAAASLSEFLARPGFGFLPGWFFFLFAASFWAIYLSLAVFYLIKRKGKEELD